MGLYFVLKYLYYLSRLEISETTHLIMIKGHVANIGDENNLIPLCYLRRLVFPEITHLIMFTGLVAVIGNENRFPI